MKKNSVTNLYQKFFSSNDNSMDESQIKSLLKQISLPGDSAFDEKKLTNYICSPQFIEHKLLSFIFDLKQIKLDIDYLSIESHQMNIAGVSCKEDITIIVDELLTYSALSFFLTVFSFANDNSTVNFERCIKNFFVLLDLQGEKHEIGVHDFNDILKMITLPANIIHTAMDIFWTSWTFLIGHELYHLSVQTEDNSIKEELKADAYGYQLLIDMIAAQKDGQVTDDIQVFYEYVYLAPIMLLEYFRVLDVYRELCGKNIVYTDHPSPINRKQQILDLFDTIVPDNFDTEEGNDLLNIFLDSLESLEKELILKKRLGKLEI